MKLTAVADLDRVTTSTSECSEMCGSLFSDTCPCEADVYTMERDGRRQFSFPVRTHVYDDTMGELK